MMNVEAPTAYVLAMDALEFSAEMLSRGPLTDSQAEYATNKLEELIIIVLADS